MNQEGFAASAVEVLRIVDETLEAFFELPIPMHPAILPDLVAGLDKCLQYYATKAKLGCGNIALLYIKISFLIYKVRSYF